MTSSRTWQYRCAAPTLAGRCGTVLDGWVREPIGDGDPGPLVEHVPCGHLWNARTGAWVPGDADLTARGLGRFVNMFAADASIGLEQTWVGNRGPGAGP